MVGIVPKYYIKFCIFFFILLVTYSAYSDLYVKYERALIKKKQCVNMGGFSGNKCYKPRYVEE